jgi:PhnB protein
MASRLNPYLAFPGNAREAMTFYENVFGGELNISTFGQFGAPEGVDPDGVMHAQLDTDSGFTLMASDLPPGAESTSGDNITVSLSGDDQQLRSYWDQLSSSGAVKMPLEKQAWGDEFGMCTDQFGIPWMVNITQPQS